MNKEIELKAKQLAEAAIKEASEEDGEVRAFRWLYIDSQERSNNTADTRAYKAHRDELMAKYPSVAGMIKEYYDLLVQNKMHTAIRLRHKIIAAYKDE